MTWLLDHHRPAPTLESAIGTVNCDVDQVIEDVRREYGDARAQSFAEAVDASN